MKINGKQFHTIWLKSKEPIAFQAIDQRKLPFEFEVFDIRRVEDAFFAIRQMVVRGAPLIGVTAACGMLLALRGFKRGDPHGYFLEKAAYLKSSRPTAVNLAFAIDEMLSLAREERDPQALLQKGLEKVNALKEKEIQFSERIGGNGLPIIESIYREKKKTVNILTHCNAGWLACIDWGTATAPVYMAHHKGIPVHVWVDETRPRNQGGRLTAYELGQEGVPHTVIADNTGGHLMQHGLVDLVIVGSDRTTINGDVANKIGTYLKALAARDNQIPFFVALPTSSIDWAISDGLSEIPVEERAPEEVAETEGWTGSEIQRVRLIPPESPAVNYGFDVTPARLVTGLITERGICQANKKSILELFPEKNMKIQKK